MGKGGTGTGEYSVGVPQFVSLNSIGGCKNVGLSAESKGPAY